MTSGPGSRLMLIGLSGAERDTLADAGRALRDQLPGLRVVVPLVTAHTRALFESQLVEHAPDLGPLLVMNATRQALAAAEEIGYPVVYTSAVTGLGIDELRDTMRQAMHARYEAKEERLGSELMRMFEGEKGWLLLPHTSGPILLPREDFKGAKRPDIKGENHAVTARRRSAFGAVRVMVNLNQTGEAAGLAAALAVGRNTAVPEIEVEAVRKELANLGAIVF